MNQSNKILPYDFGDCSKCDLFHQDIFFQKKDTKIILFVRQLILA